MHIIIAGPTGFVGTACLHQLVTNTNGLITKISCVSRRPVPFAQEYPQINVVINEDFGTWDSTILAQLKGASSCIWAVTTPLRGVEKQYGPPFAPDQTD
jgi:hypothetical protein